MNRLLTMLTLVLLLAPPVHAADSAAPRSIGEVDTRLGALIREANIPGATVALVENDRVTFAKGYGMADVTAHEPATADTPFRAGSISKSLTAIAVMTLVERGKLSLDDRLADFAPDVHFTNPWEATHPIRLANLLEHTTGWPDITTGVLAKDEKAWSVREGVQFASGSYVSRWAPGRFMVYNNAGPAVAALALERATGAPFDDYLRGAVLRPMGMATADFALPPDLARRIAKSYAPDGKETPYQYIVLKPAGSLTASARELAQLVRLFVSEGVVDGSRILSPESIARIERSETNLASPVGFTNGYGLGNTEFPDPGIAFRGHNGQIDSFTAVYGYNRRCHCGYVLMANGGSGVNFGTPMAELIQSWLTRDLSLQAAPEVPVPTATLARYAGFYRVITPPNSLLRPYLEILNGTRVQVKGNRLVFASLGDDREFLAVSDHLFRRPDREGPSVAFVEEGGKVYRLGALTGASVQTPGWMVALVGLVAAGLALGALIGVAMLLPWLWLAFRGRLAGSGGLFMRLAPLASTACFGALMAMPLMVIAGSSTSALHQLADIGPYSLTLLGCSIAFPVLALGAWVKAFRNRDARRMVRAYILIHAGSLLVTAAYLAALGWIPMRSWAM